MIQSAANIKEVPVIELWDVIMERNKVARRICVSLRLEKENFKKWEGRRRRSAELNQWSSEDLWSHKWQVCSAKRKGIQSLSSLKMCLAFSRWCSAVHQSQRPHSDSWPWIIERTPRGRGDWRDLWHSLQIASVDASQKRRLPCGRSLGNDVLIPSLYFGDAARW